MVLALVVAGGAAWLASPSGNEWVRAYVERVVTESMGEGQLVIGGLETPILNGHLRLDDVALEDGTGRPVIALDSADLQILPRFTSREAEVQELTVRGLRLDFRTDVSGDLDIVRMFPSSDVPSDPLQIPAYLDLQDIQIEDGSFAYGTEDEAIILLSALRLSGSGEGEGEHVRVEDLGGFGRLDVPALGPVSIESGAVIWNTPGSVELDALKLDLTEAKSEVDLVGVIGFEDDVTFDLTSWAHLDLDGLEPATGDIGLSNALELDARIEGPLSEVGLAGEITAPRGRVAVDLQVDLESETPTWKGSLLADRLEVESFVDAVTEETTLDGQVLLDGQGFSWPDDLTGDVELDLSDSVGWGYSLPGLKGLAVVEGGQLRITSLVYEAPWGRVTGRGELTETDFDLAVDADIWDVSGLREFGADGLSGSANAEGRVVADWSREDVQVDLDAYLLGRRLGYEDYAVIGTYRGPIRVEVDGSDVFAKGVEAELGELDASGVTLAYVTGDWEASVRPDGSVSWRSDFEGAGGNVTETVYADAVYGSAFGWVEASGSVGVDATLGLLGPGVDRFVAERGDALVTLVDDDLHFELDLYTAEESVGRLHGNADLGTRAFLFPTFRLGAQSGVNWEAQSPVRFTFTPDYDGVTELVADIDSVAGGVDARGDLGVSGPLDATVVLDGLVVPYLGALYPEELAGWTGTVDARLRVTGTGEEPDVDGHLAVQSLSIPGQAWGLNLDGELETEPDLVHFVGHMDDQKGQLAAFRASIPMETELENLALRTREPVSAELLLQPVDTERLRTTFPQAADLPAGRASGQMLVAGSLADPDAELRVGLDVALGEPPEYLRVDTTVSIEDGQVELVAVGRDRGETLLDVTGVATTQMGAVTTWLFEDGPEPDMEAPQTWVSDIQVSVLPRGVPVELLRRFVEIPEELDGRVSGAIAISGQPDRPQFGGGVQLTEGRIGAITVSPAVVGLAPVEGGWTLFGTFGFTDGNVTELRTLDLSGFIPFDLNLTSSFDLDEELAREGLDVGITGDGVPLGVLVLADPMITNARGIIDIEGRIVGTLADPLPELVVELEDGELQHLDYRVAFENLDLRVVTERTIARIENFRFMSRPLDRQRAVRFIEELVVDGSHGLSCVEGYGLESGEMLIYGTAQLEQLALSAVDFNVCAREAWFSANEESVLQVSAQVDMTGIYPKLDVRGDAVADRVELTFEEDFFLDDRGLRLDPILEVVRSGHDRVEVADEEPAFYHPWDIQLGVDLNRRARLNVVVPFLDSYGDALGLATIRLAEADLDGVLDVRLHEDVVEVLGEVTTLRGTVEVVNNDFALQTGTILFGGGSYLNPTLDLHAKRQAGRYGVIEVFIGQTVDVPTLEFASEENYTTTDILSILLFGQSTAELTGGLGVLTSGFTGVLTEQLESIGTRRVVDSFSIDSGSSGAVGGVRAGWQVGSKGWVEVAWRSADEREDNESPYSVTAQWLLTRRLQAEFSVDEEPSADLLATWRF
ncbi:MAG: hypothetical protein GY884_14155 [Proteobacteria bacterium]|nr:hypothetical protein [Pseudomonadota bacterium]